MSDVVEVRQWESKLLEASLWVIKVGKEFWFFGKEVAEALDYSKPKEAIREHVESRDKKSIRELLGPNYKMILERNLSMGHNLRPITFFQRLHPDYMLIKEIGLYSLCTKSRKEKAFPFQRWIFETIQEIRETGSYTLPGGPVENPLSLMDKVSTFEREIETLREELQSRGKVKTCNKKTQTQEISKLPIEKLKNRLKRSIEKVKKVELELEKSIREITTSSSNSSSYSSSSRRSSSDN